MAPELAAGGFSLSTVVGGVGSLSAPGAPAAKKAASQHLSAGNRRKSRSICSRLPGFRLVTRLLYAAAALVFFCHLAGRGGTVEHIGRLLGAAADLSESTGDTASALLRAVANVTVTTESFFVTAATSTKDIVYEIWRGVDLLNMTIAHTRGHVLIDDFSILSEWLGSPSGQSTSMLPPDVVSFVLNITASVSPSMPLLHQTRVFSASSGTFLEAEASATILDSGYIAVSWRYVCVEFLPLWANPCWDFIGCPVSAEAFAIQQQVREVLDTLPIPSTKLDTSELLAASASMPTLLSARFRRLLRWSFISARHFLAYLFDPMPPR